VVQKNKRGKFQVFQLYFGKEKAKRRRKYKIKRRKHHSSLNWIQIKLI